MSRIWWLWVPLALMIAQIVLDLSLSQQTLVGLLSENGPHELIQFLVIAAAFVTAVLTLLKKDMKTQPGPALWVGLAALCCFYVAGEEISWGQHLLKWTTPEYWTAINDQQETNLHNTSSWFDQKPRLILEIGVLTGGLILPLLRKFRSALVPARFTVIYPPACLAGIVLFALGIRFADEFGELTGMRLFERPSEIEELYLYYFVLLYLIALKKRLKKRTAGSE